MATYHFHVWMINPNFNHVEYYFLNNVQFINFAPAAASTYDRYHDIVAFTIPVLLTFVQIRFRSEDLFQTHPITIIVVLSSLLAYSLAFAFCVLVRYFHRYDYARKWCCMALVLFGSVSVASLVSLLVSTDDLVHLLLVGQVLLVLGVVLKLLLLGGQFLPQLLGMEQNGMRRTSTYPLLPLTSMDLS